MNYYIGAMPITPYLEHYGILGMKWGQRRYQNSDGSLTAAGRSHYGVTGTRGQGSSNKKKGLTRGQKIALGIAGTAGAAALGYGAYRLVRNRNLINLGNVRRLGSGYRSLGSGRAAEALKRMAPKLGSGSTRARIGASAAKRLTDGGHALAKRSTSLAGKVSDLSSRMASNTKWTRRPIKDVTGSWEKYVRNEILKYGGALITGGVIGKVGAAREKKKKQKNNR